MPSFFLVFYYLLLTLLYFISIPFLILLSFKQKYKKSIPKRFFLYKNTPFEKNGIWFHSCSLGETKSLKPLIDRLENETVNISVITNTGYEEAKKLSKNVRFLPFEIFLPFWIKKQKILIVTEAELWLLLFALSYHKNIKTVLINARISDRSYKSYLRFKFFYKILFSYIDKVFAQSQKDAKRLQALGAKNITVNGNLKSFQKIEITKEYQKPKEFITTLASTHEKEEEFILSNIDIKQNDKIIVVPRHPERFDEVDIFLKEFSEKNSFTYERFSNSANFDTKITLMDKMGELINIYKISDLVILGGSFVKNIGGHNPLEPAYFGCKLISGKEIFNQQTLFTLTENGYIIKNSELKGFFNMKEKLKNSKIISKSDINPVIEEIKNVV